MRLADSALLFPFPRQRRPLLVMRAATIRRLDWLDALPDWTEAQHNAWARLEKLLACVEERISPWLASRAKAQREAVKVAQDIENERRAEEREAKDRADWNERVRIRKAVEDDSRVKAARKAYDAALGKEAQTASRVRKIENALDDRPDFEIAIELRKQLTIARSQATRAYNLARKADGSVYWAECQAKSAARKQA